MPATATHQSPTSTRDKRKRPQRTRTKNVSHHPALELSTLRVQEVNLEPGKEHVVCPDCRTWCPITGLRTPKLVPHDGPNARRCIGTNRRVLLDVPIAEWRQVLAEGVTDTASRRRTSVRRKPQVKALPAISQMTSAPVSAADALTAYREHFTMCTAGRAPGRCGGTHRCADGARLAALYEQLQRTQPHRDREHKQEDRVEALLTRHRSAVARRHTAARWAEHRDNTAAGRKSLAKRSGTTIEEANNACRLHPANTVPELRGPNLPLEPHRIRT
ncbi:hypothetical protein [Streptomyces natalensis]|uniref:hypothetical protein n=1 Tax=Streptomyces natalensis TaxID=68242 RepID=UPI00068D8141|nr:hypothetical protein [Streptomyces natalensis]